MSTDRPLDPVGSIKLKLGLLVGASILVAVLVDSVGDVAGVPRWASIPVTIAAAVLATQWLARGMTSPLREMTAAAAAMAVGDYAQRVTASSSDEVGQLARAFNVMSRELATADQQRRQLVATVSHELRTPLAAQRATLENLVDGVVAPDDSSLRAALTQAERLSDLVADLLDLSRIDAGAAALRLETVDVATLLADAAAESRLSGRDVTVAVSVQPGGLVVHGDGGRLAQVVANLVDNAVRHSPPGGSVRVSARAGQDTGAARLGEWVLEVADDGPGISSERAELVFERFGSGSAADAAGGTGLGLAIARWVCELHGGSLVVLPTPPDGRGAVLRATLPMAPAPRTDHDETTPSAMTPAVPMTTRPPATPVPATPAARYAGSGPADALTNRYWPEIGLGPVPRAVVTALAIAGFAAWTWPFSSLGLAATITMLAAGGLMWLVNRERRSPWTVGMGIGAALLTLAVLLRDAGGVVILAVFVALVATAVGLTRAHGLLAMVAGVVAWPFSGLRGLPLLGRTVSAAGTRGLLWPILRTAALTVTALVLFGGLFASADAVFGSWASALVPDLGWDSLILRTFIFVAIAGVVLTGTYLSLNPPNVDLVRLPEPTRRRKIWEWAIPLGVVVALFAAFLAAEATAMWGGDAYLQRTAGLTYADYVHQGFGQLTVATMLTILVVAVTARVASRETSVDRMALRGALGALCLFTLAVVASALYRMSLYQDAYGFTTLRVFVDGIELWFGVVVLLMIIGGVRLSGAWLPRAVLVSALAFTVGFVALDPDAWVAARNIDRYEQSGRIDALYLASLSDDAAPVIADRLPAPMASCILRGGTSGGASTEIATGPGDTGWPGWNLSRARAHTARSSLPAPVGCERYLTDTYRR